jgi:hypothetical protein
MKAILILLVLFTMRYTVSAQQSPNYIRVHMESINSLTSNKFKVDVTKHNETIKITYSLCDSTSFKTLRKNPRYVMLMNSIGTNISPDSATKMQLELRLLWEQQTYYSTDSLLLNPATDTAYASLLYRLNAASTDSLENPSRVVMDGVHFKFQIQNAAAIRTLYADTPRPASHPLLYTFIHETLEVYRRKKANTFLNTGRTNNY